MGAKTDRESEMTAVKKKQLGEVQGEAFQLMGKTKQTLQKGNEL